MALYCQACGTKNSEDSRYCKHCGKPIAKPGWEDGPVADMTSMGVGRPRDPEGATVRDDGEPVEEEEGAAGEPAVATPGDQVVGDAEGRGGTIKATPEAKEGAEEPVAATPAVDVGKVPESAEATVRGQPVRAKAARPEREEPRAAVAGTSRATPKAKGREADEDDVGSRPAEGRRELSPPTGQMPSDSMVASLSIRLSEVGLQSPGRLVLLAVVVAVVLFALGAGAMYLVVRWQSGPPTAVATGVPGEERSLVIGMPVPEPAALDDEVDDGTGGGGRRATGGGSARPGPSGSGEPAGREPGEEPPPPAGSAEPAAPSGGGRDETSSSPPSGGGGGGGEEPAAPASGGGGSTAVAPPSDDGLEERDPAMSAYAGQVRYVIQRFYSARAQNCFERASREHSEPVFGTVVVRFDIGEDGNVTRASAVRNTTGSRELADCLTGQVRSWRLPAPPGGEVTMEMPFSQ